MSAILQSRPAPPGTDSSVTAQITVTFDPDPDLAPDSRFTFSGTGVTGNVYRVDDSATSVTVELRLATTDESPASFASTSVFFGVPPQGQTAPAAPPGGGSTIQFNLGAPPHFFVPWAFQISINGQIDGTTVNGIAAPTFFISRNSNGVNPQTGDRQQSVSLVYDPSAGSFTLDNSVTLGQTHLLTNTVFPLDVAVTLQGATGFSGSDLTQAIAWNSNQEPDWISPTTGSPQVSGATMNFTITGSGKGQVAGFRFAILLSSGPDAIEITSPDPILVNATIGDG
jgi:hypothetical protein